MLSFLISENIFCTFLQKIAIVLMYLGVVLILLMSGICFYLSQQIYFILLWKTLLVSDHSILKTICSCTYTQIGKMPKFCCILIIIKDKHFLKIKM